jgi:hypothetical protein
MYTPFYYLQHIFILICRCVYTLLLSVAHFWYDMSLCIHCLIIRSTFSTWHVTAYTPSYYLQHIFILTCRCVYTVLLSAAHFWHDMSLHIHRLIICSIFSTWHVTVYTLSYYPQHIFILTCCCIYTVLLSAAHFWHDISLRIHPLIICSTFSTWHVAMYTLSYYPQHIFILTCRCVYTLLLSIAHFHSNLSLHIHCLIICSTFPTWHVAAYTLSYYLQHIFDMTCRCIYTVLLSTAHFHSNLSLHIHRLIIYSTFPTWHVTAYTPSYYLQHISNMTCRCIYTLLLSAAHFHSNLLLHIHCLIICSTFSMSLALGTRLACTPHGPR